MRLPEDDCQQNQPDGSNNLFRASFCLREVFQQIHAMTYVKSACKRHDSHLSAARGVSVLLGLRESQHCGKNSVNLIENLPMT